MPVSTHSSVLNLHNSSAYRSAPNQTPTLLATIKVCFILQNHQAHLCRVRRGLVVDWFESLVEGSLFLALLAAYSFRAVWLLLRHLRNACSEESSKNPQIILICRVMWETLKSCMDRLNSPPTWLFWKHPVTAHSSLSRRTLKIASCLPNENALSPAGSVSSGWECLYDMPVVRTQCISQKGRQVRQSWGTKLTCKEVTDFFKATKWAMLDWLTKAFPLFKHLQLWDSLLVSEKLRTWECYPIITDQEEKKTANAVWLTYHQHVHFTDHVPNELSKCNHHALRNQKRKSAHDKNHLTPQFRLADSHPSPHQQFVLTQTLPLDPLYILHKHVWDQLCD